MNSPVTTDIVSYGVLSPAGAGPKALIEAVREGGTLAEAHPEDLADAGFEDFDQGAFPLRLRPVPGFRPEEYLGRKGLRNHSRTAKLGMAACEMALDGLMETIPEEHRSRTGVVLGSGTGSARAFGEFFRETYEQQRPYLVSPALFPGILMNCAASAFAMRHSFTGVNASLAGGRLSSLTALRYARNSLINGYSERLLAGGVEELSPHTAWAWQRGGALGTRGAVGEGSAVFVMQRSDTALSRSPRTLASVAACEIGFRDPEQGPLTVAAGLALCVRDALKTAGVTADDVRVVSAGSTGDHGWRAVEARGRAQALGPAAGVEVLRVQDALGETYSASGALQLAALLGHWGTTDGEPGEIGLVTSVGHDGMVGCLVVRRGTAH
ncbi:beta-ketoacyl synthase N-terminal-like domain-containing protein [Streptomyces sp. NPDC018059]|uniref:beta-ketoacyl synthase N-terminal-like domain-containing protein n=1 Tax=Streptomyces sp. NPDC018059 TaxID=3365041 RepID=UPI0037B7B4D4